MRGWYSLAQAALGSGALLLGAIGATISTEPAWAAGAPEAYPPPALGLQLSTSIAPPGSMLQVTGEGCPAGSTVKIYLNSTSAPLATTVANGEGAFSAPITIPLATTSGQHTVTAICRSVTLMAVLTIVAAPSQPEAYRPLPRTGLDTRAPLLAALTLIVLGSAIVLVARTRRLRRDLSAPRPVPPPLVTQSHHTDVHR